MGYSLWRCNMNILTAVTRVIIATAIVGTLTYVGVRNAERYFSENKEV